jgi:predicted nucleotide-binding protein (sugar kinase/HSP70/actin superfamily)
MRVGIPEEIMHLEWMPKLKTGLSQLIPKIQWLHAVKRSGPEPQFLDGDPCYPFKKMVRTALSLLNESDTLLLPRIVSLDNNLMCPNFRALPDIVILNQKRGSYRKDVPVLMPLMEIRDKRQLEGLTKEIAITLLNGTGLRDSHAPVKEDKEKTIEPEKDLSHTIALIGHPYVLADSRLNNGVPDILQTQGYDTVLARQLPYKELDTLARSRDYYVKKLYWRSAREALGAFLYFTLIRRPAGIIHLIPFNCGIDALLRIEIMSIHNNMADPPPYMVLVCDEHTQRDHVVTRIEAFLDIVHGVKIH